VRFARFLGKVALATVVTLALIDLVARLAVPHLLRLEADFSAAYLRRVVAADRAAGKVVVLGDSALWGYRLDPQVTAAAILSGKGWPIENLSYEGGSTANTYAVLRILTAAGVHPKLVIFNVNLKEFNADDSAYQTLHPAVERLAWPLLSPSERALLKPTAPQTLDAKIDRALGRVWFLYGARSDIRDLIFGQSDAADALKGVVNSLSGESAREAAAHVPTPDKFLGTYDLSPLDSKNVEVLFLHKIVDLLHDEHIPAVAILTPTNHTLLHDYIDTPDYQAQLAYVTRVLRASGVTVLNYDRRFVASEFLDNDHLTQAGNAKLATMLQKDIPQP
jgi:lysophospholipase L1-like esterase